jgi:hypothetical protein
MVVHIFDHVSYFGGLNHKLIARQGDEVELLLAIIQES